MKNSHDKNTSNSKSQTESRIRETIYRYAPISRTEIAKRLALTPPTITTSVSNLIDKGIVYECKTATPSSNINGRPSVLINFIPDSHYIIGIDQSPLHTAVCITDIRGNTIYEKMQPPLSNDYNIALSTLSTLIQSAIFDSQIKPSLLLGVGICLPGLIDYDHGIVIHNPHSDWSNKPLVTDLTAKCNLPILIQNNAQTRAIAENLFSLSDTKKFAYLFVSNGISCPLTIRDNVYGNISLGPGEIGQCIFAQNNLWPDTFAQNRLDCIASEHAIIQQCQRIMSENPDSILNQLCASSDLLTIETILSAQHQNDFYTNQIILNSIFYIAQALSFIINFAFPPLVVIDSKILANTTNQNHFYKALGKLLFSARLDEIDFIFLPFDSMRGARSATALVIQNKFLHITNFTEKNNKRRHYEEI
ncbi:MAG: ROK family transcriptional regulator [Faecalibacterium sp.]